MRLVLFFIVLATGLSAAVPPQLAAALKDFRSDPPRGWSFTQTTVAEGKSTVERCNAARPEFDRWTLVEKDGQPPSAADLTRYAETRSRRSRGGTAPKIVEQLDLSAVEKIAEAPERETFRCPVRPGQTSDKTAQFLRATLVLHKPTQTIETVELASITEFNPTLAVKISEMKTTMTYSLPTAETPSLPQKVTTRVRGTAFWLKSLDADMTVTFSNYERAVKTK